MKTPSWFLKRNFVAYILWPLSLLYSIIGKIVFSFRKLNQKSSKIPVICIGGIMAGGVGKTPIVRELATRISKSVIVMRGYGGKKTGLVSKSDTANNIGDEAKMLSASASVITGPNRVASINLAERNKFKTVIMDDGFQNPTIKKDISILVFDEKLGVGNGFVLPAGPLRETLKSGIKRADAVIVIKKDNINVDFRLPTSDLPVFYAKTKNINPGLRGNIMAFAGIGYPQKFFDSLREFLKPNAVDAIEFIPYPDHYNYSNAELNDLLERAAESNAMLVTTEKDWVKFPAKYQKKIKYVPMECKIEKAFWTWIDNKLKGKESK